MPTLRMGMYGKRALPKHGGEIELPLPISEREHEPLPVGTNLLAQCGRQHLQQLQGPHSIDRLRPVRKSLAIPIVNLSFGSCGLVC